ncbi:MAG: AMP-binding protein [Desulfomonile sp.]|nr:AMP-binding protein [Desulfomonile sp.]
MNLSEIVDRAASAWPEQTALVFENHRITYAELLRAMNRLSAGLSAMGIGKEDCVVILLGNRPEFVVSYFAVVRIGAIAVTLNPVSTPYELSHYFTECKPKVVICKADQVAGVRECNSRTGYVKAIICLDEAEGTIPYNKLLGEFSGEFKAVDLKPDDPAVVIFTAGLLGRALGATLSHKNLHTNSLMLKEQCNGGPEHRGLALIPLFHAFGAAVNLLGTMQVGGTVYLVERVDFGKLVPWLQAARITYSGMVPMVFYGLLFHPACNNLDLSSLRIGISGGAALSMEIYEKFCERYKIDIYQGYGLTEAAPVVSWNNINVKNKPSTVGVPIPDVQIEIHDDQGKPVPAGEEGEVVVKGPNVMIGYLGRPAETQMVIRDGWLYTGDLGRLDAEGYLTLTGLKKDLIITSGFNVYCQEVEEILIRNPQIADVALVGVPDLMRGQVIEALVVPEKGAQPAEREIIRFCREYLSRYKCPRKVTLVKEITRDKHGKPVSWR